MSNETLTKLIALLDAHNATYRMIHHPMAGKSEEVAKVRGTELGQGAKALVCQFKLAGVRHYVLAVLPADKQADLGKIAASFAVNRVSLASPDEVQRLTDCVFGAIPPFSFNHELCLIVDPSLFQRYSEIAFNAGTLENSIILNVDDYKRIATYQLSVFIVD